MEMAGDRWHPSCFCRKNCRKLWKTFWRVF